MSLRTVTYNVVVPYRTSDDRPALPVRIHYGSQSLTLEGIVDSGADQSAFPAAVADYLGIPAAARTPIAVSGATGQTGPTGANAAFEARVRLTVQGRDIPADVWFIPDGRHFLLGRADVFHHFLVGFDQRRKQLLLARY